MEAATLAAIVRICVGEVEQKSAQSVQSLRVYLDIGKRSKGSWRVRHWRAHLDLQVRVAIKTDRTHPALLPRPFKKCPGDPNL